MEIKVLRQKKLDDKTSLKITQSGLNGRIFVEFATNDGKLVLQKSFQNTAEGLEESKQFSKTIKSIKDLRKYFGLTLGE